MDWLDSLLSTASDALPTVVNGYVAVNGQNKQADAAKAQMLGMNGYYTNGQFKQQPGISPGVLLLMGGALLLFFVIEK